MGDEKRRGTAALSNGHRSICWQNHKNAGYLLEEGYDTEKEGETMLGPVTIAGGRSSAPGQIYNDRRIYHYECWKRPITNSALVIAWNGAPSMEIGLHYLPAQPMTDLFPEPEVQLIYIPLK